MWKSLNQDSFSYKKAKIDLRSSSKMSSWMRKEGCPTVTGQRVSPDLLRTRARKQEVIQMQQQHIHTFSGAPGSRVATCQNIYPIASIFICAFFLRSLSENEGVSKETTSKYPKRKIQLTQLTSRSVHTRSNHNCASGGTNSNTYRGQADN